MCIGFVTDETLARMWRWLTCSYYMPIKINCKTIETWNHKENHNNSWSQAILSNMWYENTSFQVRTSFCKKARAHKCNIYVATWFLYQLLVLRVISSPTLFQKTTIKANDECYSCLLFHMTIWDRASCFYCFYCFLLLPHRPYVECVTVWYWKFKWNHFLPFRMIDSLWSNDAPFFWAFEASISFRHLAIHIKI